jgi:two-component system, NarL family, sensor histidine kinase DesK
MAAGRKKSREPAIGAKPRERTGAQNGLAQALDASREAPAPRIARNILLFLLCAYVFAGAINIPADNPGHHLENTGSYVCMAIAFALQLAHIQPRAPFWPLQLRILTLTAQGVATYLPFAVYHELWGGMAGFLAGSFIILLRAPASWILFALTTASIGFVAAATHETAPWIAYFVVATANAGLVLYGLTKLTDLVRLLHSARAELARMAVAQERLRFARDLHDLLGYSLSSITLKSELAYRLADGQPEHARQELASILEVSRQALSDLRTVASSYRAMRFEDEVASVESMLLATGVDVSVEVSLPDIPPAVDTVLSTVLREGVTNMLRHSKVEHCSIVGRCSDGTVRLELINDGVNAERERDAADPAGSSGLGSLAQRLAAIGGRLEAGVLAHDKFRLVAQAPLRRARAGSDVPSDTENSPSATVAPQVPRTAGDFPRSSGGPASDE